MAYPNIISKVHSHDGENRILYKDDIELINSYGPYNHSVWNSGNYSISNEERLSGRGEYLVNCIKECIINHFSIEDIKSLSIVDIGCYDGWILHQLSDLPFKKLLGIEPRKRNIEKGKKIREILNIHSNVEYKIGEIDNLGDEQYDIVICTGLLHHVESISNAIHNLSKICRKLLFIETICLPSKHITKSLIRDIELKDVIYKYKNVNCGIIAQKYESSYFDGSAKSYSIVNVPSIESIMMYLEINGFKTIKLIPNDHYDKYILKKSGRPVNAICLYGLLEKNDNDTENNLKEVFFQHENNHINRSINMKYIFPLLNYYVYNKLSFKIPLKSLLIFAYIRSSDVYEKVMREIIKKVFISEYELEIVLSIKYNPIDKLRFEYAKQLLLSDKPEDAIVELLSITQKVNSDWRACYRSFYLLSTIYFRIRDTKLYEKYKELCMRCNPNFPTILFNYEYMMQASHPSQFNKTNLKRMH